MATMSVRLDEETKTEFLEFCNKIGISASSAFSMFAKTVVRQQRIPFEITAENPFYSEENISHLKKGAQELAEEKYIIRNVDLNVASQTPPEYGK